MQVMPLHNGEDAGHIDIPHTHISPAGTRIIVKFELAQDPTESMMLLEGRITGNGWDSSTDRGYVEINTSKQLYSRYPQHVLTLNGSPYNNEVLNVGEVYTLELSCETTATLGTHLGRIGARYAINGSTWNRFVGYIHHFEIQAPTQKSTIKLITRSVGLSMPTSNILVDQSTTPYNEPSMSLSSNGWTYDNVAGSGTKTASGWNRLYLVTTAWPPPLYKVSFDVISTGTESFHLFYNCKNSIQHGIQLPSPGSYEFHVDIGKDGRVYFDSNGTGASVANIKISKVNDGIIHIGDSDSAWRSELFTDTIP